MVSILEDMWLAGAGITGWHEAEADAAAPSVPHVYLLSMEADHRRLDNCGPVG